MKAPAIASVRRTSLNLTLVPSWPARMARPVTRAPRAGPALRCPPTFTWRSAGLKPGEKLGQYFAGNFDAAEHSSADNLKFLRETIDAKTTFWKMAPEEKIFTNAHAEFRGLAWPGNEYILGTNRAHDGIVANLPAGEWTVTVYDVMAKTAKILSISASGDFTFSSPASRAAFVHFKKNS